MIQNISSLYVSESFQDLVLVESSSNGNQLYSALGVEFNVTSASYAITSSWADNYDSSSLLKSSSINGYDITFVKGDGSEYILTVPTPESNGSVFHFLTASTEWTVVHNLDELYPLVEIYNLEDDVIGANSIESIDTNTTKITFTFPVAGHVNVSKAGNLSINVGSGSGTSGVSKIIAGTNVTISPSNGLGDVTINATGGGSGSVDTGSFMITGSVTGSILNFVLGNSSSFSLTLDTGSFSSSFASSSVSASYALTASYLEGAVDVFPYTGSAVITGSLELTGSLEVTGSINGLTIGLGSGSISSNIAIGTNTLKSNTTGEYNIAIGNQTLASNTTGDRNIAQGENALYSNTTGENNIAQGYDALTSNTEGSNNIAQGYDALTSNTEGYNNIAQGPGTLASNTTGKDNIALSDVALFNNTVGERNIAIGPSALYSNTEGEGNIALGKSALYSNTEGDYNIAQGENALFSNTTGFSNIAIGPNALYDNTEGGDNIALGRSALSFNTTGRNNIAIGDSAGRRDFSDDPNTEGEDSIFIGRDTLPLTSNDENQIVIGAGARGLGSNSTVIGNSSTTKALIWGNTTISGSLTASSITGSIGVNFTQSSPSTTWTINHNLNNQHPLVQVYGADHNMVIPTNISGSSTNQIIVTFSTAFAGYARVL
jgi:hypothetical protein